MNSKELKRLKLYTARADRTELTELYGCCLKEDEDIAEDVFYGITRNLSFDNLIKYNYIPSSRDHFYTVSRNVMDSWRDYLVSIGKWE